MTDVLSCSRDGCGKTIQNHYWGKVKSGWFFSRDGETQWCAEHVPEWVAAWREKKRLEKEKDPNEVTFSNSEKW